MKAQVDGSSNGTAKRVYEGGYLSSPQCPSCNGLIREPEEPYCPACGSENIACDSCGRYIWKGDYFCSRCGKKTMFHSGEKLKKNAKITIVLVVVFAVTVLIAILGNSVTKRLSNN